MTRQKVFQRISFCFISYISIFAIFKAHFCCISSFLLLISGCFRVFSPFFIFLRFPLDFYFLFISAKSVFPQYFYVFPFLLSVSVTSFFLLLFRYFRFLPLVRYFPIFGCSVLFLPQVAQSPDTNEY